MGATAVYRLPSILYCECLKFRGTATAAARHGGWFLGSRRLLLVLATRESGSVPARQLSKQVLPLRSRSSMALIDPKAT
jgi:hypothetical protein